ncbi:hypothetical protein [Chitinivorax sp. B]|uniref:hypothetical protein n=1 Tax=Chitinivorax sp. B TaxID=2502235 RepID=UPI0010F58BED|nr:hypothetical protein [Chitinivorax sp. B]
MILVEVAVAIRGLLVSSLMSFAVIGCGGGSGSEHAPPTHILSGIVADGYLQGATVFADLNENGQLDTGEPSAVTDADGRYALVISADVVSPTIWVDVPSSAVDMDTGQAVGRSYRLGTPTGLFAVINPITTLMRAKMMTRPGTVYAEVESQVRDGFQLNPKFPINADFLKPMDSDRLTAEQNKQNRLEAIKLHKAARVIAYQLGVRMQAAEQAWGGSLPGAQWRIVHNLLASELLGHAGQIVNQLPAGDVQAFDPVSVVVHLPVLTRASLEAALAQQAGAVNISLSQALSESELYVYPYRQPDGTVLKMRLSAQSGSGGPQSDVRTDDCLISMVSPCKFAELNGHPSRVYGSQSTDFNVLIGLFEGAIQFNQVDGRSTVASARSNSTSKLRLTQLDVSGDRLSSHVTWPLRNPDAVWPSGTKLYRVTMTNTNDLYTRFQSTPHSTLTLPDGLLTKYGESGNDYVIGSLGMRFTQTASDANGGRTGTVRFIRQDTNQALPDAGSWAWSMELIGGVLVVNVPSANRAWMNGLEWDPVFAHNGHLPDFVLQSSIAGKVMANSWRIKAGRVTEMLLLNRTAAAALDAALF